MPGPKLRVPIGESDFRKLRREGYHFVDKTSFIQDVIDANARVLLFPRPRRFGKTLNLTMLRYFLEKSSEDRAALFEGLSIMQSETARQRFQRHPLVFITFKDVKTTSWDGCVAATAGLLAEAYGEHEYLLTEGALRPQDAEEFVAVLNRRATQTQCATALKHLSRHLANYHREDVVILIDEYDTPIHAALANGYYDEAVAFFRNLLSGGFKDNPYLFKGVLTGILRVAKESIFSGLNNLAVYSLLKPEFSSCFGFTEAEVKDLTEVAGQPELLTGIREWYNGYVFGDQVIYNPWSVLSFLDSADKRFRPYWIATSSDDLIRRLLLTGTADVQRGIEALLRGESIEEPIEENIVLRDLTRRPNLLWSFLLFSGYLKIIAQREDDHWLYGTLAVPNKEVFSTYDTVFLHWMEEGLGGNDRVQALLSSLLAGDAETFEELLEELILNTLSFHDTPRAPGEEGEPPSSVPAERKPERIYQAFILGLLVHLDRRFLVRSNRESGLGRYDVMIIPRTPGQPGVVLELKVVKARRGETPEEALDAALSQIRDRKYSAELMAAGATPIHEVAAVFDGKRAWVRIRAAG